MGVSSSGSLRSDSEWNGLSKAFIGLKVPKDVSRSGEYFKATAKGDNVMSLTCIQHKKLI